jgi:AcrR family transcriptional regulator
MINTDERILEAAKKIFHARGFEGARMQVIADEAGVNKALLHYYFRNKETLFKGVFEDAFTKLLARINEIFYSDKPILIKIETFLDYYLEFLSQNSFLPVFILHALYTRPEQLKTLLEKKNLSPEKLMGQIRRQINDEMNVEIDPFHIYINILSLCIFPVLARPMIENIFTMTPEMTNKFYEERKKTLPEFILNALKGYETKKV